MATKIKTRNYIGEGPEIVLVGFDEVSCLGYAQNKNQVLKGEAPDYLALALKMGLLAFDNKQLFEMKQPPTDCKTLEPLQQHHKDDRIQYFLDDRESMRLFHQRWQAYIDEHIGIRRITVENCGFDPTAFQTLKPIRTEKKGLSKHELDFLIECRIQVENIVEQKCPNTGEPKFDVTVCSVEDEPFPFPLDFGGALPTGWRQDNLGLPPKEVRKMNRALLLVYETAYRTLLDAGVHPGQREQTSLRNLFDAEEISLHTPTSMGPMLEIEAIGLRTFKKITARPKQLAHSLANTILGYLAPSLGIKGKISTHVGACESVMGGLTDAYHELKNGMFQSTLVIGYDWAMTAVAYNGFLANHSIVNNEQVVMQAQKLIEAGIITDPQLVKDIQRRVTREQQRREELSQLQKQIRDKTIEPKLAQKKKERLQAEKATNFRNLPKKIYELASMPFCKHRNGFVMSVGAGGGFLTTLDHAIAHGLPIKAMVAGVAGKVPDGKTNSSIADLGDGVGDAFERAFLMAKSDYQVGIDDIGLWWAHGTSTPINGFGERREIHRILEKQGRSKEKPLLISGDKEIGHRLGGNFPTGACMILDDRKIYPYRNYLVTDDEVDEKFPLTKVVGPAGAGMGHALPLESDYIAINGAGFGKINSHLILKRFELSDVEIDQEARKTYEDKLQKRLELRDTLAKEIFYQEKPLVAEYDG